MKLERDPNRRNVFIVSDIDNDVRRTLEWIKSETKINIEVTSLVDLKIALLSFMLTNVAGSVAILEEIDAAVAIPILKLEREYLQKFDYNLTNDIFVTINPINIDQQLISYATM